MSGNAYYDRDVSDVPLTQVALGASYGYLAAKAADREAVTVLGAALSAYRLAHQLGFLEINLRRHPRSGRHRRSSSVGPHPLTFASNLLNDNAFLLGGVALGYAYAFFKRGRS